jgi:hypothetical protein
MSSPESGSDRPLPGLPPRPGAEEAAPGLELFYYVVESHDKGCSPSDVQAQLVTAGYAQSAAEKIVADVAEWRRKNPNAPARPASSPSPTSYNGTVIAGAVICVAGIVLTAVSFFASSSVGGTMYVFWGAIVFGGLMCLRGAAQSGRASESNQDRISN